MQQTPTNTQIAVNYHLTNMGADFRSFVESFVDQSAEARWQGWKELESKYPELFKRGIGDPENPRYEAYKKINLEKLFNELSTFEEKMWATFSQAEIIAETQVMRFKSVFPDLHENISIVFMPSLGFFNGQVVDNTLFVGVDMISQRNDNLSILFSHEFFHIYHFEKLKNRKLWQTMASPLWTEGMATFVSMHLNPGSTYEEAFMDKDLANFSENPENILQVAREYRSVLKSSFNEESGQKATLEWFMTSQRTPNRQGYALGTHVVNEVSKIIPIAKMASLDEDDFGVLVAETLENIAAN